MSESSLCLLNDRPVAVSPGDPRSALAWLRETRGATGAKEGCGEGECGACAVLLGEVTVGGRVRYRAVASCLLPIAELAGRHLVTIEGLDPPAGLNPIQQALVAAGAPQCGFCFPGIVVALTGFFLASQELSEERALVALDGNICRCTGYAAIRRAVAGLCRTHGPSLAAASDRVAELVAAGFVPASFVEAPARLSSVEAQGAEEPGTAAPVLIGGGTDLLVQEPDLLAGGPAVHLSRRPELRGIEREPDHVRIGGGVTIEELGSDPLFRELVPAAPEIVARFGSTLIRNRATVAGNLVNASPIGDVTVLLLALEAELLLVDGGARRALPLGEFYRGYKQLAREPGEWIEAVRVPARVARDAVSFEKISQRHTLDIAAVNSAARATLDGGVVRDLTLAIGGVAPIPLVAGRTARCLTGRPLDAAAIREAAQVLAEEIAPIDDVRGSAAYKRELARRLLVAHALRFAPDRLRFEEVV